MGIPFSARKVAFWGMMLLALAAGGGLWFVYTYATDSETLAALIRSQAGRYLPNARLVMGRVRIRPLVGDVTVSQLSVWKTVDGVDCPVVRIPWLSVKHDTDALMDGQLKPKEVVVSWPVLQVRRRKDGTWNLQDLLANPWPGPPLKATPLVTIENGTVHLGEGNGPAAPVLRDLSIHVAPTTEGLLAFEATAKGDAFDHLYVKGALDRETGRVVLTEGELTHLVLSDTLRERLPAEFQPALARLGLTAGVIDLNLEGVEYDPSKRDEANGAPRLTYAGSASLRSGRLGCPKLPFPLDEVSASLRVRDGVLTIEHAQGINGKTTVRARPGGSMTLTDAEGGPMSVTVDVLDLEFDDRLRDWTPPQFAKLWDEYRPQGSISLALSAVRERSGGPVGFGMGVECQDVALRYRFFPYPVDHVRGTLKWEGSRISIDMRSLISGKPARATGTIDNPGDQAIVRLRFDADNLRVDKTLLDALPPDVRKVVDQFQPTGSVRGHADVERTPPGPGDPPQGKVAIHAVVDLNEQCGVVWEGMPYAITNLTGQLELHPDSWVFKNMHGWNGLASITGEGSVKKVGPDQFQTDVHLRAEHLPFNDELRVSLQKAWQATWATLRPAGSSTVEAQIHVDQRDPARDLYHLVIVPERESRIELRLPRMPGPGVAPGETFDMPPMERIAGTFVFDNGTVTMSDVDFQFRGSPAHFASGTVTVKDTGQFKLQVKDLEVEDFRVDSGLRKIMPPVMAQFAHRLDDGRTFRFRTGLKIGWSGREGEPAWCSWDKALVVFNGNTIRTGLPLEHLQGQLDRLSGGYDGQNLTVHGMVALDSVSLLGQQLTQLSSPLDVERNRATLGNIRGMLLGGELTGKVAVDLDVTPRYEAALSLRDADLELYTRTLPGRQSMRGLVGGQIVLNGLGNDLHTLQGEGEVHISRGDLGTLPAYLALVKLLNRSPVTKSAFDSADADFTIKNGETAFDPIKFTGNAFSLRGSGTLSAQGELNLGLRLLYGRDEGLHIPGASDAMRELSGQIFQIQVLGTPAAPRFKALALKPAANAVRSIGSRRRGTLGP